MREGKGKPSYGELRTLVKGVGFGPVGKGDPFERSELGRYLKRDVLRRAGGQPGEKGTGDWGVR